VLFRSLSTTVGGRLFGAAHRPENVSDLFRDFMTSHLVVLLAFGCLLFIGYLIGSACRESRGRVRQERTRRARAAAMRLSLSFQTSGIRHQRDSMISEG
jgi:hypothetical protein